MCMCAHFDSKTIIKSIDWITNNAKSLYNRPLIVRVLIFTEFKEIFMYCTVFNIDIDDRADNTYTAIVEIITIANSYVRKIRWKVLKVKGGGDDAKRIHSTYLVEKQANFDLDIVQ